MPGVPRQITLRDDDLRNLVKNPKIGSVVKLQWNTQAEKSIYVVRKQTKMGNWLLEWPDQLTVWYVVDCFEHVREPCIQLNPEE